MSEIEKMYENARVRKCLNIGNFCKHIGATCERCKNINTRHSPQRNKLN